MRHSRLRPARARRPEVPSPGARRHLSHRRKAGVTAGSRVLVAGPGRSVSSSSRSRWRPGLRRSWPLLGRGRSTRRLVHSLKRPYGRRSDGQTGRAAALSSEASAQRRVRMSTDNGGDGSAHRACRIQTAKLSPQTRQCSGPVPLITFTGSYAWHGETTMAMSSSGSTKGSGSAGTSRLPEVVTLMWVELSPLNTSRISASASPISAGAAACFDVRGLLVCVPAVDLGWFTAQRAGVGNRRGRRLRLGIGRSVVPLEYAVAVRALPTEKAVAIERQLDRDIHLRPPY